MAVNWTAENTVMKKNSYFIDKAQQLIPGLYYREENPINCYVLSGEETICIDELCGESGTYGKGDRIVFDFGHNHAAYFSFRCLSVGSPQDAPIFVNIKFCELEKEIMADSSEYHGWISQGWIQEEWMHIDETPAAVKMERRYAFRYAVVTVLDTSQKFRIMLEDAQRVTVSAVEEETVHLVQMGDALLDKINEVSVRTLANCMQTVFEDGPKRDRRLWLGDLMLQALVNYETFCKNDLVKRCLYLFAGMTNQDGMIPACVFERPEPHMDDTFLLDYSLFFIPVLAEYYRRTGDRETLEELSPAALQQIEIAMKYVDEGGSVCEEGIDGKGGKYYCFVDWNEKLDKQCCMQAIIIYALRCAQELCSFMEKDEAEKNYRKMELKMKDAALRFFWNKDFQAFVSGTEKQISIASQVWMILAKVIEGSEAGELLDRVEKCPIVMVTPYMHHFYVMALIHSQKNEEALAHIKKYWGGMIHAGADTFWELYNPENEKESPYGSDCVNSYCHAWSCTPAYLLKLLGEIHN